VSAARTPRLSLEDGEMFEALGLILAGVVVLLTGETANGVLVLAFGVAAECVIHRVV
jgi:hypothetical protein